MNKSDLVKKIAEASELSKMDAEKPSMQLLTP